jgi:hypothetical protein
VENEGVTIALPSTAALLGVLLILVPAVSADRDTDRSLDPLVARFLERQASQLTEYRAQRRLEAHNLRFNKSGWLEATTWLDPAGGFGFSVTGEGGSGLIRTRVLRAALEAEGRALRSGEAARSRLTPDNYAFTPEGPGPEGLEVVRLTARRKEKFLVNGRLLLRPPDLDLVQMEGRPARNPSFWTTSVDIVRRYARVNGVRVPVQLDSAASVRVVGRSTFSMTYTYSSVNGAAVTPAPASPEPGPDARERRDGHRPGFARSDEHAADPALHRR